MRNTFESPVTSDIIEVGTELGPKLDEIRNARIRPERFRGTKFFTNEDIERHLAYVEVMEAEFERKLSKKTREERIIHKNGRIIETMWPMIIRDFGWLGRDSNIVFTSRYDDIKNGIDSVAQLMEPTETRNIGMEIDFTSSEAEMRDKIKKIVVGIQNHEISAVEYFDSPSTGKLRNLEMPKIAFGIHGRDMSNFISVVADAYLSKNNAAARKELRDHELKDQFLDQAANQLREFGTIAMESEDVPHGLLHHGVLERFKERQLV